MMSTPRLHRPDRLLPVMWRAILPTLLLLSAGCADQRVPHEAILGIWKSNAELTEESLKDSGKLSPHSRDFLTDDFFGHQVVEIRENESRTTHEKDNYDSGFEPYQVLEVSERFVRIKAWSNFFKSYDERVLYLEGNCYYEIFRHFGFRTYYCKEG